MSAKLLDGKLLAQTMQAEIAADAAAFTQAHGQRPGLAAVLVGDTHRVRVTSAASRRRVRKPASPVGFTTCRRRFLRPICWR